MSSILDMNQSRVIWKTFQFMKLDLKRKDWVQNTWKLIPVSKSQEERIKYGR